MHTMTIEQNQQKLPVSKLAWGLVLLVLGVALFLESVDIWDTGPIWTWWPLFLIFLGAAGEIDALRQRKSDSSYIMLGIGLWMLAGSRELFGLSYGTGFPIAIAVAGLGVMVHAIVDRPTPANKEKEQ